MEFDEFIKKRKAQAALGEQGEGEAKGGVQVVATPRRERTKVYDAIVEQWKELEKRAVRNE